MISIVSDAVVLKLFNIRVKHFYFYNKAQKDKVTRIK